ncbi:MAG: hypothetical protein ACRD0K_08235 [Egibacteraceae bacterium]
MVGEVAGGGEVVVVGLQRGEELADTEGTEGLPQIFNGIVGPSPPA